jgi:hypothetical protein
MIAARRRTAMAARRAAFAITALAIALAGCASKTVGSSSASTSPAPSAIGFPPPSPQLSAQALTLNSPVAPSPDTEKARAAEATLVADSLLRLVNLPAGATPVTSPPAAGLTAAPESEMTKRMAVAHTFFTVPGTIDSVLTFVQTHPPAGFTSNGGGWGGPPYTAEVDLYGEPTLAFQQPWLMVSVGLSGSLVGVRVDSQVVWLPVRTAAEFIPATVQGATLVATGDSQDATNKTLNLNATEARALAATINALPTATDALHGCPGISSAITVTFASTRKIVVTDSLCGVYLDVGDGVNLQLSDPGILQPGLNRLLGLPVYWPLSSPEPSVPPAVGSPAASPSITHFLCTPPGWSPLTATAEQLQEYGYPPRPDASHDQGWLQAIKAAGPPYTCPVEASSGLAGA